MAKYRKKPVVIEAIELQSLEVLHLIKIQQFVGLANNNVLAVSDGVLINTLEGTMKASIGDWIIKGIQGEFYPCKPDIFEKTYEKVEN